MFMVTLTATHTIACCYLVTIIIFVILIANNDATLVHFLVLIVRVVVPWHWPFSDIVDDMDLFYKINILLLMTWPH